MIKQYTSDSTFSNLRLELQHALIELLSVIWSVVGELCIQYKVVTIA